MDLLGSWALACDETLPGACVDPGLTLVAELPFDLEPHSGGLLVARAPVRRDSRFRKQIPETISQEESIGAFWSANGATLRWREWAWEPIPASGGGGARLA